ncbi:MAG: anti-sigma factor domain-containing protein [Firmicutes bacterium]|nr:anti-sigma factor domain-containing protein [Bacillota bacterium]
MPKSQGLVLERRGNRVFVMTRAGEFREIPLRGRIPSVGEETGLPSRWIAWLTGPDLMRKAWQKVRVRRAAAAVLAAFLVLGLLWWPSSPFNLAEMAVEAKTVAYITVDINPSVEMGIGKEHQVLVARGLNKEGKEILTGLSLAGLDVRTATRRLTNAAIRLGYLGRTGKNAVVITVTPKVAARAGATPAQQPSSVQRPSSPRSPGVLPEEALKDEVVSEVAAAVDAGLGGRSRSATVQAMVVSGEVRRQARKMGLSPARYLAFRQAEVSGPRAGEPASRELVKWEKKIAKRPDQTSVLHIVDGREIGYGPAKQGPEPPEIGPSQPPKREGAAKPAHKKTAKLDPKGYEQQAKKDKEDHKKAKEEPKAKAQEDKKQEDKKQEDKKQEDKKQEDKKEEDKKEEAKDGQKDTVLEDVNQNEEDD